MDSAASPVSSALANSLSMMLTMAAEGLRFRIRGQSTYGSTQAMGRYGGEFATSFAESK